MPIDYQWIDKAHTRVLVTVEGKVVPNDFFAGDVTLAAMLDSVNHPVDMISDYTHQNYFAPGYADRVQQMESLYRPNLRFVVFVGNPLLWELFNLYNEAYKAVSFRYTYADTVEEARQCIAQLRFEERLVAHQPPSPEFN